MKKFLSFLFIICCLLSLASCKKNKDDDNNDNNQNNQNEQNQVTYNVSFEGTSLSNQKINQGEKLSQPADPQKTNHLFVGWYMDSNFTNKVTFPLTINQDTKIYAKFYSYEEAFALARENTIGENVLGYEYDYVINATASYMGIGLTGTTEGNTKYSSSSDVRFYDSKTNSGILFNDGSKYQIRQDDTIQKITLNEKNEVVDFEAEIVSDDFTYDTSSFAKALFEYSNDQLNSIEKQSNGEYKLNTSMSISKVLSIVGNNLNHPIIEKIIGSLPETSVETDMFVTFTNDKINTYRYVMSISVTDLTFELEYLLTFKNVGIAQTITPKTFDNLYLTSSQITTQSNKIETVLNAFINKQHSSYDFSINTGMDFGASTSEINATFAGSTMRKVTSDIVYFHNDIEIDSDLKNKDLYKEVGIEDIHIKKTMLSNKEVHIIEKKLTFDKTYLQDTYDKTVDDYYLFDVYNKVNNINFIQTIISGNETTYCIGVNTSDVVSILTWLNDTLDLDPLGSASSKVKVFGSINLNSINVEEFVFKITVKNNELYKIELSSRGMIDTKYDNSVDFNTVKSGEYDFNLEIIATDDGDEFEPFDKVNDAK